MSKRIDIFSLKNMRAHMCVLINKIKTQKGIIGCYGSGQTDMTANQVLP